MSFVQHTTVVLPGATVWVIELVTAHTRVLYGMYQSTQGHIYQASVDAAKALGARYSMPIQYQTDIGVSLNT